MQYYYNESLINDLSEFEDEFMSESVKFINELKRVLK